MVTGTYFNQRDYEMSITQDCTIYVIVGLQQPSSFHMKPPRKDYWSYKNLRLCNQSSLINGHTTSREIVPRMAKAIVWSPNKLLDQLRNCLPLTMNDWCRTFMPDLSVTSCIFKLQFQSFEHDHRPYSDQIWSCYHPRVLRSTVPLVNRGPDLDCDGFRNSRLVRYKYCIMYGFANAK